MSNQKNYGIAVIFPPLFSYLNDLLESIISIRGIRHHCQFRIFICDDFDVPVEFPQGYSPDGIMCSYDEDTSDAQWLKELNLPVVNFFPSKSNTQSSVTTPIESLAALAVNHFHTLGFQQIGLLNTLEVKIAERLHEVFQRECEKREIPYWCISIPDGIQAGEWWKLDKVAPKLKEKLLNLNERTGIYTAHDTRGRLLADFCTELKIPVPEKVGILSRFDSIHARLCTPELSSIVMPTKRIGEAAIQLLVNLIANPNTENQHIQIDADEVRLRESTVGKDNPDMIILRARQLIREKACEGLTVDEITQALPIGRSTFEKRYRALTGMTAAKDIREIRMKTARELLLTSNKTVDEIAYEVGFTDSRPFVVFFKREAGETPGEFRKKFIG